MWASFLLQNLLFTGREVAAFILIVEGAGDPVYIHIWYAVSLYTTTCTLAEWFDVTLIA